jgi:hypothetical protein
MVFNSTFNNISVISWRSALLAEETGEHGENHRPAAGNWHTFKACETLKPYTQL